MFHATHKESNQTLALGKLQSPRYIIRVKFWSSQLVYSFHCIALESLTAYSILRAGRAFALKLWIFTGYMNYD